MDTMEIIMWAQATIQFFLVMTRGFPMVTTEGIPILGKPHLIGGLEPWNFMTFHILGIVIPTDSFFSEG